jgi:hypothetical protein
LDTLETAKIAQIWMNALPTMGAVIFLQTAPISLEDFPVLHVLRATLALVSARAKILMSVLPTMVAATN